MDSRSQVLHRSTRPIVEAVKILIVLFSLVQYSPALPTSNARDNEDFALKLEDYLTQSLPQEHDSVLKRVANILISNGVYKLEELKFVKPEDLVDVLPVIQIRELMDAIKKDFLVDSDKEEMTSNMKTKSSAEQIEKEPEGETNNNKIPVDSITKEEDKREDLPIEPEQRHVAPNNEAPEHTADITVKLGENEGDGNPLWDNNNEYKIPEIHANGIFNKTEVNNPIPSEQHSEDDVASHIISNTTNNNTQNEIRETPNNRSRGEAEQGKDIVLHNMGEYSVPQNKSVRHIMEPVPITNISQPLNSSQNSEKQNPAETSHQGGDYANDKFPSEYKREDSNRVDYEKKPDALIPPDVSGKLDNNSALYLKDSDNNVAENTDDINPSDKISDLGKKGIDQFENQFQKYNENMKEIEYRVKDVVSLDKNPEEVFAENNQANKENIDISTDASKNVVESQSDTVHGRAANEVAKPQKPLMSTEYSNEDETDSHIDNDLRDPLIDHVLQSDDNQLTNQRITRDDSDLTFRLPNSNRVQNDDHASFNDGENNIGVHKEYKLRKMSLNDNVSLGSMNFMTYFVIVSILVAIGYVGLHNKQKIVAVILEGRKGRGKRQKATTEATQPLVAEVVSTSEKPPSIKNFIY